MVSWYGRSGCLWLHLQVHQHLHVLMSTAVLLVFLQNSEECKKSVKWQEFCVRKIELFRSNKQSSLKTSLKVWVYPKPSGYSSSQGQMVNMGSSGENLEHRRCFALLFGIFECNLCWKKFQIFFNFYLKKIFFKGPSDLRKYLQKKPFSNKFQCWNV